MSEKTKNPATDLFEQALKDFEQAWKAGVKIQEESTKWWTDVLTKSTMAKDWQRQNQSVRDEWSPAISKQLEESMKLVEKASESSVQLLRKALETSGATSPAEGQAKLAELWRTSLNTLQDNVQAVASANTRMIESWTDLVRRTGQPTSAAK